MKGIHSLLLLSSSLIASSTLAGTMGVMLQQPSCSWVGTVSLGPIWDDGGTNQTFFLAPNIQKTYTANPSSDTLFEGELFVGLQKDLFQILQGQLGLEVAATSNAGLSGTIWDDASPQFTNHSYNYKIQHSHVALKGKLLLDLDLALMPWFSGSFGVGYNRSLNYTNTPFIFEALSNANFTAFTQTAFTYTVGGGLQKALNMNWQVGIGYEFADWGKSKLGRAIGQTLNTGLKLDHLYTNGVLLNLSYIT